MKKSLSKTFPSAAFYFGILRYRIVAVLAMSAIVGLLDGVGLSLFLPLLNMVASGDGRFATEGDGWIGFVLSSLERSGLPLTLSAVLLLMVVFFTLKGVASFVNEFIKVRLNRFFQIRLYTDLLDLLRNHPYERVLKRESGELMNSIRIETAKAIQSVKQFLTLGQQAALVAMYVTLAILSNASFALLVAFGAGFTNLIYGTLYRRTKEYSTQVVDLNRQYTSTLQQMLNNFKYLQATQTIFPFTRIVKRKMWNMVNLSSRMMHIHGFMVSIKEPLMILIVVSVMFIQLNWMGGDLAAILLSILFFYRALAAVLMFQSTYNVYNSLHGSVENVRTMREQLSALQRVPGRLPLPDAELSLELRNVGFSFDGEHRALHGVDLVVRSNETLAIVGESGSGKTTLMNVMTGVLQPVSGTVRLGGTDLAELSPDAIQQAFGYITQEPVIFSGTVFENVTLWAPKNKETLQRFHEAVKQASMHTHIEQLPQREDTLLNDDGSNLSGGQRQRISIARELYKNVPFLFLDEATSALDTETEQYIQTQLEHLSDTRSLIVIAHRLATVRHADRILVMKDGCPLFIGSYEQALKECEPFRKMVEAQRL